MTTTGTGAPEPDYRARDQYRGATAVNYDADRQRTAYDRFKWRREQDRLASALVRLAERGRILDVPVGTGRLLGAIASVAEQVVGADISDDMLELAAARSEPVLLLRSEAERLPFPDEAFDLVVSIRFFQHLPEESVLPILVELVRVSRQGALIQAPIRKPASSLIKAVVDASRFALHRGSGPRPRLHVPRPAHRYFPVRTPEFEASLRSAGMRLASSRFVTWPGAQLALMHVVSS